MKSFILFLTLTLAISSWANILSTDGNFQLIREDKFIRLFDRSSNKVLTSLELGPEIMQDMTGKMSLSLEQGFVALPLSHGKILIWDLQQGKVFAIQTSSPSTITAISFMHHSPLILVGNGQGEVHLFNLTNGEEIAQLVANDRASLPIESIKVAPSDEAFYIHASDSRESVGFNRHYIRANEANYGEENSIHFRMENSDNLNSEIKPGSMIHLASDITEDEYSAAHQRLYYFVTSMEEGKVHFSKVIDSAQVGLRSFNAFNVSDDFSKLALLKNHQNEAIVFDIAAILTQASSTTNEASSLKKTGIDVIKSIQGHLLNFTHDNRSLVAINTESGAIDIWDIHTRQLVESIQGSKDLYHAVTVGDSHIILAGLNGTIHIYSTGPNPTLINSIQLPSAISPSQAPELKGSFLAIYLNDLSAVPSVIDLNSHICGLNFTKIPPSTTK